MNGKVAILVPTYSGHKEHFQCFYQSYLEKRIQADLWVVLSEESEAEFCEGAGILLLPEMYAKNTRRGIINQKKFYGLIQLKDQYDYILVLDDDAVFHTEADLYQICKGYFQNRILYGNQATDTTIVPKVLDACMSFFTPHEQADFINSGGELYLWYNQPSIYAAGTLDDFFRVTDVDKKLAELTWYDFDYYIYMIYLMLYQGFTIRDIGVTAPFGVCEALGRKECGRLHRKKILRCRFLQLTEYMAKRLMDTEHFLTIHVDRKYSPDGRLTRIRRRLISILKGKS